MSVYIVGWREFRDMNIVGEMWKLQFLSYWLLKWGKIHKHTHTTNKQTSCCLPYRPDSFNMSIMSSVVVEGCCK